jgi:DNA integrity scanning protein DisA with diadenylate cyclase activity
MRSFDQASGRLTRIAEELREEVPGVFETLDHPNVVLSELNYAIRPRVHEGRVPTYGAVVVPRSDPTEWESLTGMAISHRLTRSLSNDATRMFADGMTSWVLRRPDDTTELVVFDRLVSSERDLVIVAETSGAVLVQRHSSGTVRMVGSFGVIRSTPAGWLFQPPVVGWLDAIGACQTPEQHRILLRLLRFAVHDLGARRVGALLVFQPSDPFAALLEDRLPIPPPLSVERPANLAPLGHVLSQFDGAAIFDGEGMLTHLGARLVPSREAEQLVEAFGGTRHTSARRYSYDEPDAVVIVVSEDGPVTVFRAGEILGRSRSEDVD